MHVRVRFETCVKLVHAGGDIWSPLIGCPVVLLMNRAVTPLVDVACNARMQR
jgi:hypothetical protein